MKFALCLLASLLWLHHSNAQCDSTFFRYTATGINDVSLIDTNKILGVSSNYIVKSDNGGKSWRNIQTHQSNRLLAMQMLDSIGYVVGDNKTILKTEDEGEHWFPLYWAPTGFNSDRYINLRDIFFFNNNRGFLLDNYGTLIATADGGRKWTDTLFGLNAGLNSITFVNDSLGYICGSNKQLYRTKDGGKTWSWTDVSIVEFSESFLKIKFIDNSTGFLLGNSGLCLKTTDGGYTWAKINTPTGNAYTDICFLTPMRGFMIGSNGPSVILQTSDGGNSWQYVSNYTSTSEQLNSIAADRRGKRIIIAGGSYGRVILSTTDAGASYQTYSLNERRRYNDIYFINDSTGYIVGEYGLALKTTDRAETWRPLQYIPSANGTDATTVFFLDSLHGFATTDDFYKTDDGGNTWVKKSLPALDYYRAIHTHFFNQQDGLVLNGGTVFKTTNGGDTWTEAVTAATGSFYTDMTVTPDGKVFAIGILGKMDVSLDKGSTWAAANLNTEKSFFGIYFQNNTTGFLGTNENEIFKTTDGGLSWTGIAVDIPSLRLRSFRFVNNMLGYMIGYSGYSYVYKTKDGGFTWEPVWQEDNYLSTLAGLSTIYSVSERGAILKTDKQQPIGEIGYIYGLEKGCLNSQSAFAIGKMDNVTYNWMLTSGGQNRYTNNLDTVVWNTTGVHTLSVSASNNCGVSQLRQIAIEVIDFQPAITVEDTLLTATEGVSYQWMRNGLNIAAADGGNARSFVPKLSGSFTVQIKSFYGCTVTTPPVVVSVPVIKVLCPGGSTSLLAYFFPATYQWQRNDGSGFVNISDNEFYAGTNTYLLQLKNIPSDWYGSQFRCVTSAGNSDLYVLQFANNWTGAQSDAWENAANWGCGSVPDKNTDVYISFSSVVINSNVAVRKLVLNPTSVLTVKPGNTLTITH